MTTLQIIVAIFWCGLYLWWTIYSVIDLFKNLPDIKAITWTWIIIHFTLFVIAVVLGTVIAFNQK